MRVKLYGRSGRGIARLPGSGEDCRIRRPMRVKGAAFRAPCDVQIDAVTAVYHAGHALAREAWHRYRGKR